MEHESYQYAELIALLKEQGRTEAEIGGILDRIKVYEENVDRDLLMESLANGSLSWEQFLSDVSQTSRNDPAGISDGSALGILAK